MNSPYALPTRFRFGAAIAIACMVATGAAASVQPTPAPGSVPLPAAASAQPIAPPTGASAAGVKLGFCDVVGLSSRLVMTEPYAKPLREKQNQMNAVVQPMEVELKTLIDQIRKADPQPGVKPIAPETAAKLREQFAARQQEYSVVSQKAANDFSQFIAHANAEAYKQVLAAIDVVAERRGYPVVFAVRSLDDLKSADTPPAFIQSVLARPAVRYPAADDLTADVAKELKLPDPPAAAPAVPGSPATGTAPTPASTPAPSPAAPTAPAPAKKP